MEIHRMPTSSNSDSNSEPDVVANCDLAHQFIEHLFVREDATGSPGKAPREDDWKAIQNAVAGSNSVEHAIGRSIVTADLISRGKYNDPHGPGGSGSRSALRDLLSARKGTMSAFLATSV